MGFENAGQHFPQSQDMGSQEVWPVVNNVLFPVQGNSEADQPIPKEPNSPQSGPELPKRQPGETYTKPGPFTPLETPQDD